MKEERKKMEGITLQEHFATLQDPRVERTKRHQLLAIITIAFCAVICGADTWVDVEEFGHAKRAWLETFLNLLSAHPLARYLWARLRASGPRTVSSVFSLVGAGHQHFPNCEASRHRWQDRPPFP